MSDTTASLRRKIGRAGDLQSVVRTMYYHTMEFRDWWAGLMMWWPIMR